MSSLAIGFLGSYWVTLDGAPLTAFGTDKVQALLAYLALESRTPQRRETLAALLWPDHSEAAARTSLRQALYRLRRALGDQHASVPHLLSTAKIVQLDPASDCWLDVTEFEAIISSCRARHPRGVSLSPDSVARLEAAISLYRGDFMSGFSLAHCPRFEWWQLSRQESCHRQALDALTCLTDYYERRGEYDLCSEYAQKKIELEPWRESAYRHYMRALALSGRRAEALHQYDVCRAILAREMGIEPSAATTHLYDRIRMGGLGYRGE